MNPQTPVERTDLELAADLKDRLLDQCADLRTQLQAMKDRADALAAEVESLQADNNQQRTNYYQLNKDLCERGAENTRLRNEIAQLKARVVGLMEG